MNSKCRTACVRLADQIRYGYETLKLTVISKSEFICEPLVLAIQELPELCGFAFCFGAEYGGNPPSLESAKEIVLMYFKINRSEYLQGS